MMLLGKRTRPPMKRTTSMTEFTLDFNDGGAGMDPHNPFNGGGGGAGGIPDQRLATSAVSSPRPHRRNSADYVETAHFLRMCSLCKRRLISGRDIYMYRGDSAFCSLECRQQQMTQDERKDKCSLASKKEIPNVTTGNQASVAGETVAAV